MPNIVVVALDISQDDPGFDLFTSQAFDVQLAILALKIREICRIFTIEKADQDQWIIAWREYGLTHTKFRYLTQQQKSRLKHDMSQITMEYPKLTIIAGSIATKRLVKNLDKIRGAILENCAQREITNVSEAQLIEQELLFLIRNTSYVFSNKKCIARCDKVFPVNETKYIHKSKYARFRPGNNDGSGSYINQNIGIEICADHVAGVLSSYTSSSQFIELKREVPCIQFVLSASTTLKMQHCVSPYVIHIDCTHPTSLLRTSSETNTNVSLYSYNVLSQRSVLRLVEPQTGNAYVISLLPKILDSNASGLKSFLKYGNEVCLKQLSQDEYNVLISSLSEKYVNAENKKLKYINKLFYDLLRIPTDDEILENILKTALKRQDRKMMEFIIRELKPSTTLLAKVIADERPAVVSKYSSTQHYRFYQPEQRPQVQPGSSYVPSDYIPLLLE